MNCDDLLKLLSEYIDGEVDPTICRELEKHLADCNPCRVVVDNLRQTVRLYRHGQEYELPGPFRERLHASLREKWKQRRPTRGGSEPDQGPNQA